MRAIEVSLSLAGKVLDVGREGGTIGALTKEKKPV
jgi:hypothetical protein